MIRIASVFISILLACTCCSLSRAVNVWVLECERWEKTEITDCGITVKLVCAAHCRFPRCSDPSVISWSFVWVGVRSSFCPVSLSLERSQLCRPKHLFSVLIRALGLTSLRSWLDWALPHKAISMRNGHYTPIQFPVHLILYWVSPLECYAWLVCTNLQHLETSVNGQWRSQSYQLCIKAKCLYFWKLNPASSSLRV